MCSQQFVLLVEQVQHGMKEEGQDVEGNEQGGEMLLAVAERAMLISGVWREIRKGRILLN